MKLCGLTVLTLCSPMIGLPLQDGIYNGSIMDIDSLSDLHDSESAAYLATKAPLVRSSSSDSGSGVTTTMHVHQCCAAWLVDCRVDALKRYHSRTYKQLIGVAMRSGRGRTHTFGEGAL
jgi:hypothetical protein